MVLSSLSFFFFLLLVGLSCTDLSHSGGVFLNICFHTCFWSDEDHGVLIFVCLLAMDLVEDDQSLESFMNLVTEFCAQVGGGQNATRRKFSYCLLIVLFHAGVLVSPDICGIWFGKIIEDHIND
ncbi:uncharacterized protein BX664DRAFT_321921 [Halteromyces radiatus]|uniref:uncharacterized protein n=1 Tax=Halteromyces radiatus TaxID=101107 RepID=UPI00221E6D2A|nr:uncharacterized protein BX664DRAFT_321921 [Halteromyces radiatus]KAI8099708.1 hypothetical protein BX664DRAFT_321921 [Halteromyces radiatus]